MANASRVTSNVKELPAKWSVQYATGVTELDEQHKMPFKMSEDYRDALDQGHGERVCGVLLASLDQYARGRFGREEHCMYRYQCPAATMNSQAHREFTKALAEFSQRYAQDGFSRSDAQDLVQFIDGWLATHIVRVDLQLKPCVENERLGSRAPSIRDVTSATK